MRPAAPPPQLPPLPPRVELERGDGPLLLLHAFSGQRRLGDLQFHFEAAQAAAAPAGGRLVMVSVDIVHGPRGDLACDATVAYWVGAILAGKAVGLVVGPPCETWSAARGKGDGPRRL
eukprot:6315398-Lingulodinium_polyedra.AAC.1